MRRDLLLELRQWRRNKAFAIATILTLAVGIGGTTAIFSLVHTVLLKSLPVADPQSLYRLGDRDVCCVISGYQTRFAIFSSPLYEYLRDRTPEFLEMAATEAAREALSVRTGSSDLPEPFTGEFVSANYFSTFGVAAFAGRVLTASDDRPAAAPVAVMSYRTWEQHYGLAPSIIGSTFVVNGTPLTIAGIAPPGFFGETLRTDSPDFWLPLAVEPLLRGKSSLMNHPDQHWLYVVGRLRPGVSPESVEAKVNVALKQWWMSVASLPPGTALDAKAVARQHISLSPAGAGIGGMKNEYAASLKILMAISALVLLIACANIANLLLARGMNARIQTSIRLALGAPHRQLIRQALTGSVALSLTGGIFGVALAWAGTRALLWLAFTGASFVPIDPRPSLPVLGFTFLLSLLTGLLFGVLPAWGLTRFDPIDALRGAGRSTRGRSGWPQRWLTVLQSALSLVLLTGAGLLSESLANLENQRYGFAAEGRVAVRVNPSFAGYSPEQLFTVYQRLEDRIPRIPGVRGASFSLYSPMRGGAWFSGIDLEGRAAENGRNFSAMWNRVSPHFFETVGTPLIRGRALDERDTPTSARVAVVNRAFVGRYYGKEEPLGKRFGFSSGRYLMYEIVGVVENAIYANPREPQDPMFFLPYLQMAPSEWSNSALARSNFVQDIELRTGSSAPSLDLEVRRALQEVDSNLSVLKITPMGEQLKRNFTRERLIARLTGFFGLVALALACLGLYGVTAYAVAQRTSEIGIRAALGASGSRVIRLVLSGALLQVCCAVAIGIPAAVTASRLLESQVYGLKTSDPLALIRATVLLLLCASVAGLIPAIRASRLDPISALRTE